LHSRDSDSAKRDRMKMCIAQKWKARTTPAMGSKFIPIIIIIIVIIICTVGSIDRED